MRKIQSHPLMSLSFAGLIVMLVSLLGIKGAIAQNQPTWRSIFLDWLSQEPKDRGSGKNSGGRPEETMCLITPGKDAKLWTTLPLFVWQGGYSVTGIRPKDSSIQWQNSESLQSHTTKHLRYVSKALAPGKEYEWGLFVDPNRRSPTQSFTFKIMDGKQRAVITRDLKVLESRLKAQNASEEAISLQRANYFAKKGLRTDALQAIYSVKQPSTELKQVMQDIEQQACQSQE